MRADVSVNMFIYQALKNKRLTIFGGQQIRPNITIKDLSNVYKHFIFKKLKPGFYNAGFENLKILNIAEKVKKFIDCKIIIKKNNNDPRSYRQNSDKLIKTGFKVKYKIDDAIKDIIEMYKKNKKIFSKNVFSVKTINRLNIK
jgi:nucleoside-diphosphate-sugar epimerase|tara:strand:- start:179 stop:607 length:429 start_codon:yes stop_codon:yes gene_type:complete